ncbi:hypothetical protein BC831DRAFT_433354 [Entophlyctis helioformis]|nr:hypothetical protein BC831DRAFT_433354 [Entophlyctis helioformis]
MSFASFLNIDTDRVSKTAVYTVEVGDAKPGEGKARRYRQTPLGPLVTLPEGVTNLHENFLKGRRIAGDAPFLGTRPVVDGVAGPYEWESYNQVYTRIQNLGSGLLKRGLKTGDNVGLFSVNRAEWVIGEQSCYMYSWTTVPLYDTLGDEAIEYILQLTETPVVLATADKAAQLVELALKLKSLKVVVIMDTPSEELIAKGKAAGIEVVSIKAIEAEGAAAPVPAVPTNGETVATICFTSGTTGLPKGVILSHKNILSFKAGVDLHKQTKNVYDFDHNDVHISYLPLAHIFERTIQAALVNVGGQVGFYQGDTLKLLDDVAELKPTIFVSVPRLYNRIYDKVLANAKAAGGIATSLFNMAYAAKKENLTHGYIKHPFWDALVFAKVRARLGGRVKYLLTGAAPISKDVIDFLRICFSAELTEGYGQTETSAAACTTIFEDLTSGHIGVPMPHCEIKLIDVPNLNYTSADKPHPRGEICIRGSNVFSGYYKEPAKTAETLDADGWCHTGDIGLWDAQGRLVIIDRVKHIFKLSQGEYIAPEKVEIIYQKHEAVAQAFVYGDSLQSAVVGVIIPDEETFPKWAAEQGITGKSYVELCQDQEVSKILLKTLIAYGKQNDLKGFENIRAIHLSSTLMTPESGLLSPTFKLKRHEAKAFYAAQIEAMYKSIA